MERSSKELVRGLFDLKEQPRAPFIPWVCSFAAQLEQVDPETMFSDAGVLSRALINAQKLFGYDAIPASFDTSLEAEALGCQIDWGTEGALPAVASHPLSEGSTLEELNSISDIEKRGRIPAILEATKRIKAIRGRDAAVIGVITGPLTLARHLKGDSLLTDLNQGGADASKIVALAGNVALKLCRSYCELGVDVIAIADEILGQASPSVLQAATSPLRSIWNVARFYNVHSLIVSRNCVQNNTEPILGLQADGAALSGNIDYARLGEAALKQNHCYAGIVPDALLLESNSQADCLKGAHSLRGKGFFLSTEWEMPYATDVNKLHDLMRVIRSSPAS